MGNVPKKVLFEREHKKGQETYESMLKVTNHLRDANKNDNEVSSHICQNVYHQQINKWQVLARMWRKRNPCALLVGMQIGTSTVEDSMEFPQKTKNGTPIRPSDPTSRNVSQETRNTNHMPSPPTPLACVHWLRLYACIQVLQLISSSLPIHSPVFLL